MADQRTVADIERDLAATRARLADNLAHLVVEVHPKAVVHRSVVEGKRQVRAAADRGKRHLREALETGKDTARRTYSAVIAEFRTPEDRWDARRIAIAGGVVAVVVTVVVLVSHAKK